jgi:hypothetical protein
LISSTDQRALKPLSPISGSNGAGAPSNLGCGQVDLMSIDALRASGRNVSWLLPASVSFMRNPKPASSRKDFSGTAVEMPAEPAYASADMGALSPPTTRSSTPRSARDSELSTSNRASDHFTSRPSFGCNRWAKSRVTKDPSIATLARYTGVRYSPTLR